MKHKIISVSHAKANFSQLTKNVFEEGFAYLVTKDGTPVSVLVPVEDYEALLETEEVSMNKDLMDNLQAALNDEKSHRLWKRDAKGKWTKFKKNKKAA